jgi:hypothetical protein
MRTIKTYSKGRPFIMRFSGAGRVLVCSLPRRLCLLQTMKWIRKSPFGRQEDAAENMVALLCREAESHGTPLTEAEKQMLTREPADVLPEDLRIRVTKLIKEILNREKTTDIGNDPKSFLASFEWASDNAFPQIAALTEEVITSGGFGNLPPLHGREWIKDRAQLIGCGLLVVLIMMAIVVIVGLIVHGK